MKVRRWVKKLIIELNALNNYNFINPACPNVIRCGDMPFNFLLMF